MQNGQKTNFVKSRKTFEGTTKDGKSRKITLFISQAEAQSLLERATEAARGGDGACLTVFLGESKFGKGTYGTISLEQSTPTNRYQAAAAPQAAPQPVGGNKPTIGFKPKISVKA